MGASIFGQTLPTQPGGELRVCARQSVSNSLPKVGKIEVITAENELGQMVSFPQVPAMAEAPCQARSEVNKSTGITEHSSLLACYVEAGTHSEW
jgi:hypothetical protein